MAERPIVIYGDPVLREVSRVIEEVTPEIKNLVSDMKDTLKKAQGLGLAAVQVGVPVRLFIVDLALIDLSETLRVFINPEILETAGEVEIEEGCLSFPGLYQKIVRNEKVRVKALDQDGNEFIIEADGMKARAILHEYDHLEGKLFIDRMSPMTRTMLRGRLRKLTAAS